MAGIFVREQTREKGDLSRRRRDGLLPYTSIPPSIHDEQTMPQRTYNIIIGWLLARFERRVKMSKLKDQISLGTIRTVRNILPEKYRMNQVLSLERQNL